MFLAYIDPGSGALVWQLAIAGLMGFVFYSEKSGRGSCGGSGGCSGAAAPLRTNLASRAETKD
jgi:hypothetical protein